MLILTIWTYFQFCGSVQAFLLGVIFWNNIKIRFLILIEFTYPVPQSFLNVIFKDELLDTLSSSILIFKHFICAYTPLFQTK